MKKMSKAVGVIIDDDLLFHAAGVINDHSTLCGLDAGEHLGGGTLIVPAECRKINCPTCRTIWENTIQLRLNPSDFE